MSGLPFELLLALRYLRPKRTFVSVITLISALGVTLGVAVLIIVLSVMSGFDRLSREKILGFNPHLKIAETNHTMRDYPRVVKTALANPLVRAAAPFVLEQVLVVTEPPTGQRQVWAPYLRGIVPQLETNLSILPQSIIAGKFDVSDRGLLVGEEFAANLHLSVHDRVEVYAPAVFERLFEMARTNHGELPAGTRLPLPPEYEVRGIFDVGYYEYNLSFVVGSLRDTQDLYGLDNTVHGVMVMLHNPDQAPAVQEELARALGPQYEVTTWMETNANLLGALVVEKNVMFYLLFFIMIVAAMCILSALITFVVQKTREIGMLKALGAADLQVSLLFLSQGALVGLIGVLAGYGLGRLALAYRNEFLRLMNHLTGFVLFPPSIYNFTELPALINPRDIWLVCGSALLVCTLGGAIPAWLAGRLKPVDALRYE
ncbi:MAG TPA: FtsX-like permease family protein [Dongiaceae bacterium]|nr:FtsX-like permease family protein [Dongiaceae bacterium]